MYQNIKFDKRHPDFALIFNESQASLTSTRSTGGEGGQVMTPLVHDVEIRESLSRIENQSFALHPPRPPGLRACRSRLKSASNLYSKHQMKSIRGPLMQTGREILE